MNFATVEAVLATLKIRDCHWQWHVSQLFQLGSVTYAELQQVCRLPRTAMRSSKSIVAGRSLSILCHFTHQSSAFSTKLFVRLIAVVRHRYRNFVRLSCLNCSLSPWLPIIMGPSLEGHVNCCTPSVYLSVRPSVASNLLEIGETWKPQIW